MKPSQFVLDASIALAWGFEDGGGDYVDAVLDSLDTGKAFVPAVWPLEMGNVLLVAERRKRLTKNDSARFLGLLAALPIVVEQERPERMLNEILALGRETCLSTYDASYLDLAMRLNLPIASQDSGLVNAAKRCRVEIYSPRKGLRKQQAKRSS